MHVDPHELQSKSKEEVHTEKAAGCHQPAHPHDGPSTPPPSTPPPRPLPQQYFINHRATIELTDFLYGYGNVHSLLCLPAWLSLCDLFATVYDHATGSCLPPTAAAMFHQIGARDRKNPSPFQFNHQTAPTDVPVALLNEYVTLAQCKSDPDLALHGVLMVRKMLSVEKEPPIDEVIDTGIIDLLVHYVRHGKLPQLQFEAAWALTNIASGQPGHVKAVTSAGAIEALIDVVVSDDANVREQASWGLGNIAGEGVEYRDHILALGGLPKLIEAFENPGNSVTVKRNIAWAASNFVRGKRPPLDAVQQAVPFFSKNIPADPKRFIGDEEVIVDSLWGLSYCSDGDVNHIECVASSPVVLALLSQYLDATLKSSMITPALRTFGNIATGSDKQTQSVINCGALGKFSQLLAHPKRAIQKEVAWLISNITAGSVDQIQAVIDANIIPPLLNACSTTTFAEVRKEVVWAVANFTCGGSNQQMTYLVQQEVFSHLGVAIKQSFDAKTISPALEALSNIISVETPTSFKKEFLSAHVSKDETVVEVIQNLVSHPVNEIADYAQSLLDQIGTEEKDAGVTTFSV